MLVFTKTQNVVRRFFNLSLRTACRLPEGTHLTGWKPLG